MVLHHPSINARFLHVAPRAPPPQAAGLCLWLFVAFAGGALVVHSMCPQHVNSFFPFLGLSLERTSVGSPPSPLPSSGTRSGCLFAHVGIAP